jgi:hypothetical protein
MNNYFNWGDAYTRGEIVIPPRIKCTWCGRFISYEDLRSGKATHFMVTPDSDYSCEEWESNCKKCREKDVG